MQGDAYSKLMQLFDPGGNLPEDCREWVRPFLAALEEFNMLAFKEGFNSSHDHWRGVSHNHERAAFMAGAMADQDNGQWVFEGEEQKSDIEAFLAYLQWCRPAVAPEP